MVILSTTSKQRLVDLHPHLIKVVNKACEIHNGDFMVVEGRRTLERQKELLKSGASQTLKSRHITGHAIDIAPLIDGKISWDLKNYYPIAKTFWLASQATGVPIRWGGCWQELNGSFTGPEEAVQAYAKLRKSQGRKAFIDAPHFELPERLYP